MQKKRDHSPSRSFGNHHGKRIQVDSPEVEVSSEHSSTQSGHYMPKLIVNTRPSSTQWRQWSFSPPSSPTMANADDGMAAEISKSTGDQMYSDSGSFRGNMADSDLDTVFRDCFSYSDTDEVSIQTTQKRYIKMVRTSCKLSKDSDWMEAQLK